MAGWTSSPAARRVASSAYATDRGASGCASGGRAKRSAGVGDPEDAFAIDVDGDGRTDVVSASEGKTRALHVHWHRDGGWITEALPAAQGLTQWMFGLPLQIDDRHGVDIVAAGKGDDAWIGWFEAPSRPRDLAAWRWHPIRRVGWAMTVQGVDMNDDRRVDLLVSDRYGSRRGVFWLENTGSGTWREHPIGSEDGQVLFLTRADLDGDGLEDVLAAAKPRQILVHRRLDASGRRWERSQLEWPESAGHAKAVRAADLDGDGRLELIVSCEGAVPPMEGVFVLKQVDGAWQPRPLAGPRGLKFDLIELLDLDGDGDLDVITCEETAGLGLVWYENPAR